MTEQGPRPLNFFERFLVYGAAIRNQWLGTRERFWIPNPKEHRIKSPQARRAFSEQVLPAIKDGKSHLSVVGQRLNGAFSDWETIEVVPENLPDRLIAITNHSNALTLQGMLQIPAVSEVLSRHTGSSAERHFTWVMANKKDFLEKHMDNPLKAWALRPIREWLNRHTDQIMVNFTNAWGFVLVDKNNRGIFQMKSVLNEHGFLGFFPTLSAQRVMGEVNPKVAESIVFLAKKAEVPVVPIGFSPDFVRGACCVCVGEPLYFHGPKVLPAWSPEKTTTLFGVEIARQLPKYMRGIYRDML